MPISDAHRLSTNAPPPPADDADCQERLALLINVGILGAEISEMDTGIIDKAIVAGEIAAQASKTPLFGNLPEQDAPFSASGPKPRQLGRYSLNKELGIPLALWQEHPLSPAVLNDPKFIDDVANGFCDRSALLTELHRTQRGASLSLRDLLLGGEQREFAINVRLSNARVAEKAQQAFQLNNSIDPRLLERALIAALRARADRAGYTFSEADLRRTVQLAAMSEPDKLLAAIKQEQAMRVRLSADEPIADPLFDAEDLPKAIKSAHGAFPSGMNNPETDFVRFLEGDTSGTVMWWLRNPHTAPWATRLVLPTGDRFFPDFAVGVRGRSTPDWVALVEIKDDGSDGRLHSDKNVLKMQVQHREYRNVFWTYQGDGGFERLAYNEALNRIQPISLFQVSQMVLIGG